MRLKQTFQTILVFAAMLSLVASVTVTPVAAEDDATLGSDGVSVNSSDANANGSASADADTDGVDVEASGSGGGSSTSVECEVDDSTSETSCPTAGNDGGDSSELPGSPDDPSETAPAGSVGSDAARAVEDGLGATPREISTDRLPLSDAPLPADPSASVTRPGVFVGEDSATAYTYYRAFEDGRGTFGLVMASASAEEVSVYSNPQVSNRSDDYRGRNTLRVRPSDGTVDANVRETGPDRTLGTVASCDLSAGWLRLCGVKNTAPVTSEDLPQDQLPAIPDRVKEEAGVSYGLLFLVADTAVQEPSSMVGLAIGTAADQTPEASPVNPGNPPYNPNDPPVDPTDRSTVDPHWWLNPRQPSVSDNGVILYGNGHAGVNDEVFLEGIGAGSVGSDGDQFGALYLRGSDGQNEYDADTTRADGTTHTTADGPVGGNATLGQSDRRGGVVVDLGGEGYGQSFGGDGGGSGGAPDGIPGGLPVDPSQPPSLPA